MSKIKHFSCDNKPHFYGGYVKFTDMWIMELKRQVYSLYSLYISGQIAELYISEKTRL
jgi:hypothetical protein